jgi:hypothetical protein
MKVTIEINGVSRMVELPDEIARALEAIAERNGISLATALQQAIANEKFLEDQQANGSKLLIETNRQLRELVREPAPA